MLTVRELLDALDGLDDNALITLSVESDNTIYETNASWCCYRRVDNRDTIRLTGVCE